ncbi:MAG: DUF2330 domain-containing protein, partial [Mycobacteriaceae bacterium]|nr:DUF2330 domain-containing protein [Mycobacteriaceae bacterium]
MTRWLALAGVPLLVAGVLLTIAPGVAVACACGAVVSPDAGARIADEEALVTTDGRGKEIIVMRLNLQSNADNAALIVPTPAPASVTASSQYVFDDLAALSAPRVETRRHWTFNPNLMPGAANRAAAPTVVAQVQLGPLEATTLTGGDMSCVQQWLDAHGYTMRPEVVSRLDPYLKQGWSFVAMRLTSTVALDGSVDPVMLTFSSDRLVYPMRMSAAAHTPQQVVVYTLGQHRMQRTDSDAATQSTTVDYAGSVAGRINYAALSSLAHDGGAYLTKTSVQIADPGSITSDFEFGVAPNDDPVQQVV